MHKRANQSHLNFSPRGRTQACNDSIDTSPRRYNAGPWREAHYHSVPHSGNVVADAALELVALLPRTLIHQGVRKRPSLGASLKLMFSLHIPQSAGATETSAAPGTDQEELRKAAQNPIAGLISVPIGHARRRAALLFFVHRGLFQTLPTHASG